MPARTHALTYSLAGELDEREFLSLLNNVFPTHCHENEAALTSEFASADTNGSNTISFTEVCPRRHLSNSTTRSLAT